MNNTSGGSHDERNGSSRYLRIAVRYYLIQSGLEVFGIFLVDLAGILSVNVNGLEYFFAKTIYFGWLYVLFFLVLNFLGRSESNRSFSLVNGVLSLAFVLLQASVNGFAMMLYPLIAVVLGSVLTGWICRTVFKN